MSIFRRHYRSVNVRQAKQLIADGYTLLDVRSGKEWAAGHADGAIRIPLGRLESELSQLPVATPIVTICHSGIRSAMAARRLAKHGYTVANLRGGMIAWDRAKERS